MRILDRDGQEIELKDDDDDDYIPGMRDDYRTDDGEIESSGFIIEDVPEDDYDAGDFGAEDGEEDDDGYDGFGGFAGDEMDMEEE